MHRPRRLLATLLCGLIAASTSLAGLQAVDGAGRAIRSLQVGSTLFVRAEGLQPNRLYEFRLGVGDDAPSRHDAVRFARVGSDAEGRVRPFALWYESGVAGCSPHARGVELPPSTYRSFDDADRALRGKTLMLAVYPVEKDPSGKKLPLDLPTGKAVAVQHLPVSARQSPMLFASDADGCLVNGQEAGSADLFVSGRNFEPGEELSVAVVPDQFVWHAADPIADMTGERGEPEMNRVQVGKDGRFTVRVWDRARQRRGAFDLVAHRAAPGQGIPHVGDTDIVSYAQEAGVVLWQRCPPGCLCRPGRRRRGPSSRRWRASRWNSAPSRSGRW